ncbi:hypothetical protein OS493_002539 [Desmophyllum pertusum]|uniref:BTB domain-containing protein n=1 Tax=Desmophyllum pertusum TaxID=174260 RepID=A0A9X0CP37_9CNID|nr:hypothetical protein OS493_002539 [Desmophyllum pertusum]
MILKARSEVMAAMLGGSFRESDMDTEIEIKDASLQSFLALLEYLYTDHAPIEEGDSVDIMILADRFCFAKTCDFVRAEGIGDGKPSDVINLLLTSQAHNAKQLSGWCLHFISSNLSVFESTEEFDLVQGENRQHVYEHRWPPLSKLNSKCKVM